MNVNVKVSLTDEQRRTIHENFYGKKGMVSRKDVNDICQTAVTDMLMKKQIGDKVADAMKESISYDEPMEELDYVNCDVKELVKQNVLLLTRLNRLQYMIDTRGLKK